MAKVQQSKKAKAESTGEKKDKLPLGKRYAAQFRKMANRVGGHRFAKAPATAHESVAKIQSDIDEAAVLLAGIAKALEELPDEFKARKSGGYQPKVIVGAVVQIADKRRALYPESLIPHEGLTVEALAGTKVVVTANGLRTMLPRNHIKVTAQAA